MGNLKVLGVIPARYASSRFPGKPLIDLKGKSMIQRVYEGCAKSQLIEKLVVATDDQRIYDHVLEFGGNAMMTDENHPSGTDRCAEVAKSFPEMEVVINIQGDEPLVNFKQIEQLIQAFENPSTQIATLGISTTDLSEVENPNRIKVVTDANGSALYFSRSPIPSKSHGAERVAQNFAYTRHIGLYAYRNAVLQELCALPRTELEQLESLEQLRWLYHGYAIQVVSTQIETPNIDCPEDVEAVLAQL